MTTFLFIVLAVVFLAAIVSTLHGVVRGNLFDCFVWCLFGGEWLNSLGECLAGVADGLSDSLGDS
jgi:hypothetical protein